MRQVARFTVPAAPPHRAAQTRSATLICCGLLLALSLVPKSTAQDFTVVLLPDTQFYSESYPQIFNAQTQWIANNAAAMNIKVVLGLGDVVQMANSTEFGNGNAAYNTLQGVVPYFAAIGNHDYNNDDPGGRTASATVFNSYFGPSRYNYPGSGFVASYQLGSNENFYGVLTINAKAYLFLVLELFPRNAVLQWAQGIIRANPDKEVILITHSYQYYDGTRVSQCTNHNAQVYNVPTDNDGEGIWANLASQFPNVTLVLSGHVVHGTTWSASRRLDAGLNGNWVNQILANYQNITNGGNGYLRIMQFSAANNTISVSTYSPYLNASLTDSADQFTVTWHANSGTGTGTIQGLVETPACALIGGATVFWPGGSTTTGSGGGYTLKGVPAGVTTVTVNAAGYPALTRTVAVGAGLTAYVPFYPTTATGSVSGTVLNTAGSTVGSTTISYGGGSVTADASGNFTVSGVPATYFEMTASASGYKSLTQLASVAAAKTTTLNFVLVPTTAPTIGAISGTVTNSSTGAAVSGATVSYSGGSATTNASGAYTLSNVPAGGVSLTASANGYTNATATVSVTAGATTTQNFALAPTTTTGNITGTVTNSSTGAAISGATVAYSGGSATTNASGAYTLSNVPAGSVSLTASASGYSSGNATASVTAGATTTQNFALAPAVVSSGIAVVQQTTCTSTNTTTAVCTLAAPPAVGDALFVLASNNNAHVASVSGGGVSWARAASSGSHQVNDVFYGLNSTGAGSTIAITWTTATEAGAVSVVEFSNIAASAALDKSAVASGSGTVIATGPIATTAASELVIATAAWHNSGSISAPSNGFAALAASSNGSAAKMTPAFLVTSATGTFSTGWTLTSSGGWDADIVSFKGK